MKVRIEILAPHAIPRVEAFVDSVLLWHSKTFPHTFSRMESWLFLVSDANLQHLDRMTVAVAVLPHILYYLEWMLGDGMADTDDKTIPIGVIQEMRNCLRYTSWSHFIFHLIMALCTILSERNLVAQVVVAIDLCIETSLCWIVKALFFEVLRQVVHEIMFHEKILWFFDPILAQPAEENEDFAEGWGI